jgi:hypothetical protein
MNKVTRRAGYAMLHHKKYSSGNTRVVKVEEGEAGTIFELRLFGKLIARYYPSLSKLWISDAGWKTRTTKERLNGILDTFGINARIYQEKFTWFITIEGEKFEYDGWQEFETNLGKRMN